MKERLNHDLTFHEFERSDSDSSSLIRKLADFYNSVFPEAGNYGSEFSQHFLENFILRTLDCVCGKVVYSMDSSMRITGFVSCFLFSKRAIPKEAPKGSYLHIYSLASGHTSFGNIAGLVNKLLSDIDSDYCAMFISRNSDMYRRNVYQRFGFHEVETAEPEVPFLYITRDELQRQ